MKILITWSKWNIDIGESLVSAFSLLGYDAEIFYDNFPDRTITQAKIFRKLGLWELYKKFLFKYKKIVSDRFFEKVIKSKPELVFVIGGLNFLPDIILKIRNTLHIYVVNWVIDDPAFSNIYESSMLYQLSAYSHFFLVDEAWRDSLIFNNGNTFYLPHAADEKIFYPIPLKKDIDIFFAGSVSPKYPNTSSGVFRGFILDFLVKSGFKITAIIPDGNEIFNYFPSLKQMRIISNFASPAEINKFYNRSKIVLNINAPQLKTDFSERLFSIALSKNFQLVDFKSKLGVLFPEGAVISFSNFKELGEKTSFYLQHNEERDRTASIAYEHASRYHTYMQRAKYIVEKIYEDK